MLKPQVFEHHFLSLTKYPVNFEHNPSNSLISLLFFDKN